LHSFWQQPLETKKLTWQTPPAPLSWNWRHSVIFICAD